MAYSWTTGKAPGLPWLQSFVDAIFGKWSLMLGLIFCYRELFLYSNRRKRTIIRRTFIVYDFKWRFKICHKDYNVDVDKDETFWWKTFKSFDARLIVIFKFISDVYYEIWMIWWVIRGQLGIDNVSLEMKLIVMGKCDVFIEVDWLLLGGVRIYIYI